MTRTILHCDLNNFFASVECKLNPELKSMRIAVCGSKEDRHGIVLAKNDNAKKYGVKTGEAIWEAQRKCPCLVTVPPHYDKYVHYSAIIRKIYERYTDLVEPFGMDECWLDVTGSTRLFGSGEQIADHIRETVKRETGLSISVGVSFNKVFAKLGSDMKKPDATTVISKDDFKEKLYGLPAKDMIGIGKATDENLRRIGVITIGDIAMLPLETMKLRLGKHGEYIWYCARGLDCSPVMQADYKAPIKSIGRGVTTVHDLENDKDVHTVMLSLSVEIARKLRKSGLTAGAVQVEIRNSKLMTKLFQCPLPFETANAGVIEKHAFTLFCSRYDRIYPVRSVTVRVIRLAETAAARQLEIGVDAEHTEKLERLDRTADKIISKYGSKILRPMSMLSADLLPENGSKPTLPGSPYRG